MDMDAARAFFMLCIILSFSASASGVDLRQATQITMSESETNIVLGQDYSFENISVYKDTLSFELYNFSINHNHSSNLNISLENFNPKAPIGENLINLTVTKPKNNYTSINLSLENLPEPEGSYKVLNRTKINTGSFKISFNTVETSSVVIKHKSVGKEEDKDSEESADDESGGGGSIGGDFDFPSENETSSENDTPVNSSLGDHGDLKSILDKIGFERDSISRSVSLGSSAMLNLKIENRADQLISGNIKTDSIPVIDYDKTIEIKPEETKVIGIELNSSRKGSFSGFVRFESQGEQISIPVDLRIHREDNIANLSIEQEGLTTNFTVNVRNASKGDKIKTLIYSKEGKLIQEEVDKITSSQKQIEYNLGEQVYSKDYGVISKIVSENGVVSEKSENLTVRYKQEKTKDEIIVGIIALFLLVSSVMLISLLWRRRQKAETDEISVSSEKADPNSFGYEDNKTGSNKIGGGTHKESVEKKVEQIRNDVIERSKHEEKILGHFSKIINLKRSDKGNIKLEKLLDRSERIKKKVKFMNRVPISIKSKVNQVMISLEKGNYEEVKKGLAETEKLVDKELTEEYNL